MSKQPLTLRRFVAGAAIVAACVALGARRPVLADAHGPAAHLVGRSLDASGVYAGPVDIVIERWSTDEEYDKVMKPMMKSGPAAVLAVLEKVRVRAGYVLTPGIQNTGARALLRRSWNIDFAREIKTGKGRRIVIASQDHLPIGEFPKDVALGTPHKMDVLEFRFDKNGKGVGKLADGSKITVNKSTKMIEIAKFDTEPVRLADVAMQTPRARQLPPKQYYGSTKPAESSK
jgi:hypothetical protein